MQSADKHASLSNSNSFKAPKLDGKNVKVFLFITPKTQLIFLKLAS
jgi:hypothetical protein